MTQNKLLALLSTVLFTAIGCGQTGLSTEQASLKAANSCAGMQKPAVDPAHINIDGTAATKPGDPAQYVLSEDLSCNTGQEVAWRTVAGGSGHGNGSAFVASFKKPGEYVVAASITDPNSSTPYEISTKTIVSPDLGINGPQYGMAELEHHFELAVPAGITLVGAQWNFGDGTNPVNGLVPPDHTYMAAGQYVVTVNVMAANGDNAVLTHNINVLPPTDGLECVRELSTSGPTQATVNVPVNMSVYIPQCVAFRVGSVSWTYGDNTTPGTDQSVSHTYAAEGVYTVTVDLFNRENTTTPILTLTRQITVVPGNGEEEPEEPGPVDPNLCSTIGQTRNIAGDIYTEERACGVQGKQTLSYRDTITQECRMIGEIKRWAEASRSKELLSEGECQSQSCELPPEAMVGVDNVAMNIVLINGKYYLLHGGTKTFYSSQTPAGACSEVAVTRTCNNGVLGGSTSNVYLSCNNGCPGVGPHGTTQTGVVTGEATVPKVCSYGETGITDIFHTLSDRTCENGTVTNSNSRTGGIKVAGVCPSYQWVGTENWSTCSANCGGKQNRTFECRDGAGQPAPAVRCGEAGPPVQERLCDANPEAVRRSESSSVVEDASSSVSCPANQIGTISKTRTVTTTKVYACINHQVALESTTAVPGAWIEEKYCKDLVAHRCSQDSLDNNGANGRYKWLQKCRSSVPAIDQFLTANAGLEKMTIYKVKNLILNGRIVYPTFLNRNGKAWIAPKTESASCSVPEGAYIATVCLASCSTPEQLVLAQEGNGGNLLKYSSFVEAWEKNFKFVATLASNSTMSSKFVTKTAVDQWVTELVDGDHEILEFTTKSGGNLRLTPNHPVVTSEGTMKFAGDFKVGESLVRLGGERDPIVSIRSYNHFGKVFNVFVKSNALHKNIVVTNGYLNGTAFFQNDGAQHLNRRLFRGALIRGVLD